MQLITKVVEVLVTDHEATGSKVRNLRRVAGLTLKDISAKTRLSVTYLSALECGNRPWTQHLVDKVTKAIGTT